MAVLNINTLKQLFKTLQTGKRFLKSRGINLIWVFSGLEEKKRKRGLTRS